MEKKVKVTIQLPEELRRKVKIKAAKTGKPYAEIVREALEKWAEDDPPPPKED